MNKDENIPRIRFPEKLGFATFSTASNVVFNFKSIFYLFFLTNVMGIRIEHAGIITAVGMVWDAVNDPLVGFWATNHTFKNGEKVHPFALYCAVPWAISVVLMFTCFNVSYWLRFFIAMFIYFFFELLNTFVSIPYNSMGSLATKLDADRRSINVARNLGGCIGSGIGGVALYPLLDLFGGLDEAGNVLQNDMGRRAFMLSASVMGLICIVGCFAHYFTTKERVHQKNPDQSKLSLKQVFTMLLHCKSWVLNTCYIICYGLLNMLVMNNLNYYATYVLGSAAKATPILAVYLVISIITTLCTGAIDRKLGRRRTMIFAAAVYVLGKIWFIFDPYNIASIYCNAFSVAVAMAITFVMFNTNRNNIVDIIEWKNDRRIDSLVSTCDNLAAKLSEAAGNLIMTQVLGFMGFNAALAAQPQSAINTICALLGWVPATVAVIMLVVCFFHPIEGEMKQMHEES